MKNLKLMLALFTIGLFLSCEKENNIPINPQTEPPTEEIDTEFSEYFGNEINRTFIGQVIDTNENPIENVTITIGSSTETTDSNGVFCINDATVNQRFAYIKAEKSGYVHGSRAVVPTTGTNSVRIMLLQETIAGTTSSGTTDTINLSSGASVTLNGDYVDENGVAYSGNVDVVLHYLDATDDDINLQMPGMLYAENSNGEERMLQTYGMLAVELRGSSGENLNLAEGTTAEIKMPLDASLVADAPNTIPLWHFDEDKGYWIEEGQATLVGNAYVGTVSHFSFWNCDIPAQAVNICVTVTDVDSNPISNAYVTITSTTYGTRGGITNSNGEVCGLIPENETLDINVYDSDICGNNSIYFASVGPYTTDSTLDIIITSTDVISEEITGLFNDCDGNPVSNGYVTLAYGNDISFEPVTNGMFNTNMIRCADENTFTIEGIDINNTQTTGVISYTFSTPSTDIGTITSCNAITEFIQYSIDDDTEELLITSGITATYEPSQNSLSISGSSTNCFYLWGTLNTQPIDSYDYNNVGITECISMANDSSNTVIYNVTQLGPVDDYIDINFSGDYNDFNGNPHTITGTIHVLRD